MRKTDRQTHTDRQERGRGRRVAEKTETRGKESEKKKSKRREARCDRDFGRQRAKEEVGGGDRRGWQRLIA